MAILETVKKGFLTRKTASGYVKLLPDLLPKRISTSPSYLSGKTSDVSTEMVNLRNILVDRTGCYKYGVLMMDMYNNSWDYYNDDDANKPRLIRQGQMVCMYGTLTVNSTVAASNDPVTMFTIDNPEIFAPPRQMVFVCQGSGSNKWTMYVYPSGEVKIARYGVTAAVNIPKTVWLPFCVSWIKSFPTKNT